MSKKVLGTCGICGGSVSVPRIWHGINPPTPSCDSCRAVPEQPHGPIVKMSPHPARRPGR